MCEQAVIIQYQRWRDHSIDINECDITEVLGDSACLTRGPHSLNNMSRGDATPLSIKHTAASAERCATRSSPVPDVRFTPGEKMVGPVDMCVSIHQIGSLFLFISFFPERRF